jgi:hypothetical protein
MLQQNMLNVRFLGRPYGFAVPYVVIGAFRGRFQTDEVLIIQFPATGQNHCPFQYILQLPYVSGPTISPQHSQ